MDCKKYQIPILLLIASILILPRIYYVEHFASPLPFWDQWDSEWLGLLKPWMNGNWEAKLLLAPHNEHRIVPTRILTLLIFNMAGEWNNLVEARTNIPLSALSPAILLGALLKTDDLGYVKWLTVVIVLLGASLPFSWENFLIGFQSQFYFMNLFTVSALFLSAYHSDKTWATVCIVAVSILSTLTVASGLLTPASVIILVLIKGYNESRLSASSLTLVGILLAIAILAYGTIPPTPTHKMLHARSVQEFFQTIFHLMGWPLRGSNPFHAVLWIPGAVIVTLLFIRRQFTRIDLLFAGCMAWSAMQIIALAYARGNNLTYHMPPRYTEVLLLGLAGNSWFVLKIPSLTRTQRQRAAGWMLLTIFHVAVIFTYIQRGVLDFRILEEERLRRLTQAENVCRYMSTHEYAAIEKTGTQIPYPDPKRFQLILDDPDLKRAFNFDNLCRSY